MDIIEVDCKKYIKQSSRKEQIVLELAKYGETVEDILQQYIDDEILSAPAYVIDRNGTIYSLYKDEFWSNHLPDTGLGMQKFGLIPRNCSKNSIGIALVNDGELEIGAKGKLYRKGTDKIFTWVVNGVPVKREGEEGFVIKYYDAYTKKQIDSLKELLVKLTAWYEINATYDTTIWDLSLKALNGTPGIYVQDSFIEGPGGIHETTRLLAMLQSIEQERLDFFNRTKEN